MTHSNICFMRQDQETYERCHAILGLPEGVDWASLTVNFGTNEIGEVTLVLLPSGEQVRALAELAITSIADSCAAPGPDMTDEEHLEEAILNEARASVNLDRDTRS